MMKSRLISDDGLHITEQGFNIDVRLPWYRSLPLSSVEVTEVSLNGEKIDPGTISIEINNKNYGLSELPELINEWWFVLDSAFLHVKHKKLKHGAKYEVGVTIGLQPPYIKGLIRMTQSKKILRAN